MFESESRDDHAIAIIIYTGKIVLTIIEWSL
jgi:hypothetical protein